MKVVEKNIKDLIRAEYNPRQLSDKQHADLRSSLQRFGMVDPVLVNINEDRKNIIIGGHMRSLVWEELGNKTIPCVELDLTLEQERELNVRLNKNTGQFDMDALANYFDQDELIDWGFESFEFGLDDFEVDELGEEELEEDDFDVDEAAKQVDVVEGDLIEIGEHRLLCGDSTCSDTVAKLMNGEKADMVFTDPPYGVDYEGGALTKRNKLDNDQKNTNIYQEVLPNVILFTKDKAPMYIWHAAGYADMASHLWDSGIQIRSQIIWNKNIAQFGALSAQYKQKHEPCFYCFKGGNAPYWYGPTNEVTVWDVNRESKNEFHPTQKPIELPARALNNSSKKGDYVIDFFLGSGSTMVASHQLKRKCYGMELDPKYCQVIIERMNNSFPDLEIKINGKKYEPIKEQ